MNHDDHENRPEEQSADAQITAMLERLEIEKAPASLTRRLMRIPREERRRDKQWSWQPPRWALAPALAAVPLLALLAVFMMPQQPSAAEVEQARKDLAVAFAYIDKVGYRTGDEIRSVLAGELRHGVKDTLSEHLPFTKQSRKEETI